MAKTEKLDDLGVNSPTLSKRDADLIFEAGTALAGISAGLNPSRSAAKMVSNARDIISRVYTQEIICAYLRILRDHQLDNESKELEKEYALLKKLAEQTPQ